jgi:hypothetical protein
MFFSRSSLTVAPDNARADAIAAIEERLHDAKRGRSAKPCFIRDERSRK